MRNNSNSSTARIMQETILANRAAAQPAATCPDFHGATRTANRAGRLMRVCSDRSCSWGGEHLVEAEAAARAANLAMGVAR